MFSPEFMLYLIDPDGAAEKQISKNIHLEINKNADAPNNKDNFFLRFLMGGKLAQAKE